MTAKLTQDEAVKYALSMVGKGYDYDNAYGWQCFDTANYYWHQLFGHGLKGGGAADIPTHNNFKGEATVHENTKSFLAKPGDVVVFNRNYGGGYGHVGIVVGATLNQLDVVEQNWNGGGLNKTEVTARRKHNYDFPMWFIRPNFKADQKKKGKTLKYNRDEVKGYSLPKRGYNPKGVVIHNDAGSATAMQYHDSLVNAPLAQLENGIAHSYISGDTVWQALPESKIAWHTANNNGNTNYYGIEVCQSMSASDKDFLYSEQSVFQEAARLLKKWNLPVNRSTVMLHCQFVSTACPHRSMKLHTGWDPVKQGRPSQAIINKLKDYFISQIKQYYEGKIPDGETIDPKPAPKPDNNTGGWRKNSYGILYKAETATFTCTVSSGIITRYNGPWTGHPQAGLLQIGQSVVYDEIEDFDGYIWISWVTNNGTRVYMPIGNSDGRGNRIGNAWGTFS